MEPGATTATEAVISNKAVVSELYTPIDTEWQTRLLLLEPGVLDEPLVAGLHVVHFIPVVGLWDEKANTRIQDYKALSYVWGKPLFTEPLQCDGVVLGITKSLATALRALRSLDKVEPIWADAVCINQLDDVEKSSHIGRIFNIFQNAAQVIAWMGAPGVETGHLLKYCQDHAHEANLQEMRLKVDTVGDWSWGRRTDRSPPTPAVFRAVSEMATHPWTNRVWIRQEVHAARHIVFRWSDSTAIKWEGLVHVFDQCMDLPGEGTLGGSPLSKFIDMKAGTRRDGGRFPEMPSDDGENIVSLLDSALTCEATNPRDRIYALLGMSSVERTTHQHLLERWKDSPMLLVDYQRSISKVFQDFTKYLMNSDANISCLRLTTFTARHRAMALPSWTVDWSGINQTNVDWKGYINASKRRLGPVRLGWQNPTETGTIQLRGYAISCVERIDLTQGQAFAWEIQKIPKDSNGSTELSPRDFEEVMNCLMAVEPETKAYVKALVQRMIDEPQYIWNNLATWQIQVRLQLQNIDWRLDAQSSESSDTKHVTARRLGDVAEPTFPFRSLKRRFNQDNQDSQIRGRVDWFEGRLEDLWIVPLTTATGDILAHVEGGQDPIVLRPQQSGAYLFVGFAEAPEESTTMYKESQIYARYGYQLRNPFERWISEPPQDFTIV
ncbi:hypothetical protein M8818_005038 [Zalaria obscura]|uniref:Uncharacterized protein n=1 Tax=Zalaria obscura TaxID=2024903 RepID=A0ACC3SAC1_9PEZI